MRLIEGRLIALVIGSVCLLAPALGMAQEAEAPAELRSLLEGDLGARRVARRRRGAPSAAGRRPVVESRWRRRGHVPPRDGGRVRVVRRLRDLPDGCLELELYVRAGPDRERTVVRGGRRQGAVGGRAAAVHDSPRRGRDRSRGNERSDANTRAGTSPTCRTAGCCASTARWPTSGRAAAGAAASGCGWGRMRPQ